MSTEILIQTKQTSALKSEQGLSNLEVFALRLFHPRAIFIYMVGLIWSFFYLWNHNWQMALITCIVGVVFSLLSVMDADPQKLSETSMGKIGLLHFHPINLTIRSGGAAILIYGIWQRSLELFLVGTSIFLLGHIFGWSKVDSKFSTNN